MVFRKRKVIGPAGLAFAFKTILFTILLFCPVQIDAFGDFSRFDFFLSIFFHLAIAINRPTNNDKREKKSKWWIGKLTIDRVELIFADGCVPFRSVQ